MSEEEPGADKAWVRIATRLSPAELVAFCHDAERLLRINSMYEIEEWRSEGEGRFFVKVRNLGNGLTLATSLRVEPRPDGLRIAYASGLKSATELRVDPAAAADGGGTGGTGAGQGATLVLTDDYSGTPEAQRQARAAEIDRSLVQWGHDLHRYLRHWARWSHLGPWRWYMRRIWQPMKPKARRITYVLIVIALLDLVAGVVAIAFFALHRL
jgi:hypothetical protein